MKRRPTLFLWLAFLLTLLVGSGSALPAAGVWQCQHASEIVTAAPDSSTAMPCHMRRHSGSGMSGMACCAFHPRMTAPGTHLTAPGCRPTFTPLIAALGAVPERGHLALHPVMTAAGERPCGAFSPAAVLQTLPARQRPPPDIRLLRSSCFSALCLRGPPSA